MACVDEHDSAQQAQRADHGGKRTFWAKLLSEMIEDLDFIAIGFYFGGATAKKITKLFAAGYMRLIGGRA
jgi:hypothetical protein